MWKGTGGTGRTTGGGNDGGVAMAMRVEHARVSSGLHSGGGDLTGGWEDEECRTTCCCWTWHTESASAGGAQ